MRLAIVSPLFSALRASHFLLLRQKKVSKEKAIPGSVSPSGIPCATQFERGLRNSGCALRQSSPFFRSNLRCSAPSKGPGKASTPNRLGWFLPFFSGRPQQSNFWPYTLIVDAFRVPMSGAEQRRSAGGCRLALSEPQASLASRPAFRVAEGTGLCPAPTLGSPFLWLLSFGEAKESTPALKAESSGKKNAIPQSPRARKAETCRKPNDQTLSRRTP